MFIALDPLTISGAVRRSGTQVVKKHFENRSRSFEWRHVLLFWLESINISLLRSEDQSEEKIGCPD